MELKRIPSKILINKYKITWSYETKRGYYREQQRTIDHISKQDAKNTFFKWISEMKEKEPHRAMLNVNILSIAKEEGQERYIEI